MGRPDYAIKCFNEALAIEEDFETLNYLSQLYIQTGEFGKAHELLERMIALEPELTSTYLTLANLCFMQEDYQEMADAAQKAIALEEGNATYLKLHASIISTSPTSATAKAFRYTAVAACALLKTSAAQLRPHARCSPKTALLSRPTPHV